MNDDSERAHEVTVPHAPCTMPAAAVGCVIRKNATKAIAAHPRYFFIRALASSNIPAVTPTLEASLAQLYSPDQW